MHRLKSVFFLILCFFPLLITANISANESRPERLRAQNTNISIYKSYNDVKQTQNTNIPIYKSFDNIFPDAEANSITSFIQDEDGMIWIGTNKGIYNYDGYNSYPHFSTGDKSNTRIYCMTALNSDYLLLGGDKGLLIYDIKSNSYQDIEQVINIVINNNKVNNNNSGKAVDKYVDNPVKNRITVDNSKLPSDIRSIYKDNNDIWIGAIAGLYKLNLSTGEITSFKASEHKGLTHDAIYSIIAGCKGRIYFGTYNGLCFYDKKYKSFTELKIPGAGERNNIFVNSLLYDKDKECIR